jgi:hypothetical protein
VLQSKCTGSRGGNMFRYGNPYDLRHTKKMNENCPACGQPLDMEPGFYYGTNMISYALAVLLGVFTFFLWWGLVGFSLHDSRFFWWMGVNAFLLVALQPPLMRLSRKVWLSFFVRYSARWQDGDFIEQYNVNREYGNNWYCPINRIRRKNETNVTLMSPVLLLQGTGHSGEPCLTELYRHLSEVLRPSFCEDDSASCACWL